MTAVFEDISFEKAVDALEAFSRDFKRDLWADPTLEGVNTLKFKHQDWLTFTFFKNQKKLMMQGRNEVVIENRQILAQMLQTTWSNLLAKNNKHKRLKSDKSFRN